MRSFRNVCREKKKLECENLELKDALQSARSSRDSALEELKRSEGQLVCAKKRLLHLKVTHEVDVRVMREREYELRGPLPEIEPDVDLARALSNIDSAFDEEASDGVPIDGSILGALEFSEDVKPPCAVLLGVHSSVEVIDLTEDSDEEPEPDDPDEAALSWGESLALGKLEDSDEEPEPEPEPDEAVEETESEPEEAVEPEEIDHPLSWGQRLSLATLEDPDEDRDVEGEAVEPEESSEPEPGELEEAPQFVRVRITRNKRSRDEGYKTDPTWTKSAESQARKRYSLGMANKSDYFMVY